MVVSNAMSVAPLANHAVWRPCVFFLVSDRRRYVSSDPYLEIELLHLL